MEQLLVAVPLWGLVFARVAGVALLVPPFGERHVPFTLRIAVAALLAVPLYHVTGAHEPVVAGLPTYILWVGRNLAVGLVIGGSVAVVLWAAQMAGRYLDGLAGWHLVGAQVGAAGHLVYLLSAVLFVVVDGHHGVLMALSASFGLVSAGPDTVGAIAEQALLLLPARMFLASLMIAAPALLAVLLALTVLAAMERVSAELAAVQLAECLGPLLTMLVLIAALPAVAYVALWQLQMALQHLAELL